MKKIGLGLAVILLASLFGGCISDGSDITKLVGINTRGSLSNPAILGEPVIVNTPDGTFEVTVTDAIRGERAYHIIKGANMFNPDPEEGYEYLLVKVRFRYLSGETSYYVSEFSFNAYCDGVGYSSAIVVLPNNYPKFKGVNLMPGGKIEGWIPYLVPKNKNVMIAFEHLFEPVCFIKV